ncbi:hypothetical protein CR513_09042, partial [Mucuna pruriens]
MSPPSRPATAPLHSGTIEAAIDYSTLIGKSIKVMDTMIWRRINIIKVGGKIGIGNIMDKDWKESGGCKKDWGKHYLLRNYKYHQCLCTPYRLVQELPQEEKIFIDTGLNGNGGSEARQFIRSHGRIIYTLKAYDFFLARSSNKRVWKDCKESLTTQHRVLVIDVHFKRCKQKTQQLTNPRISGVTTQGYKYLTFKKKLLKINGCHKFTK